MNTFDPRTEANIGTLTPNTQAAARSFLQAIIESKRLHDGWVVKIISGKRSYAEQADLYAQGRSRPGKIVTNAQPGFSNHNFGLAFDIGIFNPQGQYIDDLVDTHAMTEADVDVLYELLPALARPFGLTWGGSWKGFEDEPHYELTVWPGLAENVKLARLRAMVANGEVLA